MAKARQVGMPHQPQLVPGRRLKISSAGGFFRVSKEGAIRARSLQVCSARKRIRSSVSQASTISSALAIVMRLG